MALNIVRMVTYQDENPNINLNDPAMRQFCEETLKIKYIISTFRDDPWNQIRQGIDLQ